MEKTRLEEKEGLKIRTDYANILNVGSNIQKIKRWKVRVVGGVTMGTNN